MNQSVDNDTEFSQDERQLSRKLEFARFEYQELAYKADLVTVEPKKRRVWIPMSIAASLVAIITFSLFGPADESVKNKSRYTVSKVSVPSAISPSLKPNIKLSHKKRFLFAHKPVSKNKPRARFKIPARPSRQSS